MVLLDIPSVLTVIVNVELYLMCNISKYYKSSATDCFGKTLMYWFVKLPKYTRRGEGATIQPCTLDINPNPYRRGLDQETLDIGKPFLLSDKTEPTSLNRYSGRQDDENQENLDEQRVLFFQSELSIIMWYLKYANNYELNFPSWLCQSGQGVLFYDMCV